MKRNDCRVCHSTDLQKVVNLGESPLANNFLTSSQLENPEQKYPLELFFCNGCTFVQLGEVVSPDALFRDYLYVSSTSPVFVKHFEDLAVEVGSRYSYPKGSLVVDIGSNDGILLKPFLKQGMKVLGIDPAKKISAKANSENIPTLTTYFTKKNAKEIATLYGKAKIITATSVFSHVDDLDDFMEGVKHLLAEDGIFLIEVYHIGSMIANMHFDMIYHEHLSYFSIRTITQLLERHSMKADHINITNTHGGSMRVIARKAVNNTELLREGPVKEGSGLEYPETYKEFHRKINKIGSELKATIDQLKTSGYKIAGYGASAKSTTLLNYFGIGKDHLSCIYDDNPLKENLYTPGTHVPINNPASLWDRPDYILILAWNFTQPIMEKLRKRGYAGKFIIPLPEPVIVE